MILMYLWNSPVIKFCTLTCSSKCALSAHFCPCSLFKSGHQWNSLQTLAHVCSSLCLLGLPASCCWCLMSEEVDKGFITGCLWISCLLNGISRWWEFVDNHAMVHEMTCIMTWYSLYNYFWCQIMNLRFFSNPQPDYPNTCIFIPNNSQSWCCLQRHK